MCTYGRHIARTVRIHSAGMKEHRLTFVDYPALKLIEHGSSIGIEDGNRHSLHNGLPMVRHHERHLVDASVMVGRRPVKQSRVRIEERTWRQEITQELDWITVWIASLQIEAQAIILTNGAILRFTKG